MKKALVVAILSIIVVAAVVYTHTNMADGEYPIKVSVGNVELGKSKLAYRTLGYIQGITALDGMTITVRGSMFDDLNN